MIEPTTTTVIKKKNVDGEFEGNIKERAWKTEYYTLVIRYFFNSDDNSSKGNTQVVIYNNNPFKIEIVPDIDSNFNYSGVSVSMFSNLAETAQELVELSENLKSVANSVELFNQVISERL